MWKKIVTVVLILTFVTPAQTADQIPAKNRLAQGSRCLPEVKEININQMPCIQLARANHQALPSALIRAISQDLGQHPEGYYTSHRVFFIDLNNDGFQRHKLF